MLGYFFCISIKKVVGAFITDDLLRHAGSSINYKIEHSTRFVLSFDKIYQPRIIEIKKYQIFIPSIFQVFVIVILSLLISILFVVFFYMIYFGNYYGNTYDPFDFSDFAISSFFGRPSNILYIFTNIISDFISVVVAINVYIAIRNSLAALFVYFTAPIFLIVASSYISLMLSVALDLDSIAYVAGRTVNGPLEMISWSYDMITFSGLFQTRPDHNLIVVWEDLSDDDLISTILLPAFTLPLMAQVIFLSSMLSIFILMLSIENSPINIAIRKSCEMLISLDQKMKAVGYHKEPQKYLSLICLASWTAFSLAVLIGRSIL